jgi:hypothetical protein
MWSRSHSRCAADHLVAIPVYLSKILLPALVPPAGRQILRADHLFAAVEPAVACRTKP